MDVGNFRAENPLLLLAEACLCLVFPRVDIEKCPAPAKKLSVDDPSRYFQDVSLPISSNLQNICEETRILREVDNLCD